MWSVVSRLGCMVYGGSAPCVWLARVLDFPWGPSFFFRVRLPIWGPVRVPVGMSSSSSIPPVHHVPLSSSSSPWLVRDLQSVVGGGVYAHFWLITRASSGCAVRCFRGLLRWRVLVALIKETGGFVRLRLQLRRDARHRRLPPTPATDACHRRPPPTPTRSHDSSRNPRAMPGVVPACPTKHPRHTAVVFAEKHRRAAFGSLPAAFAVLHLLCSNRSLGNTFGAHRSPRELPPRRAAGNPLPGTLPPTRKYSQSRCTQQASGALRDYCRCSLSGLSHSETAQISRPPSAIGDRSHRRGRSGRAVGVVSVFDLVLRFAFE